MQFDLPLEELRAYKPALDGIVAPDFDAFWAETLADAETAATPIELKSHDNGLTQIDSFDVTFAGYGGAPIRAWLNVPKGAGGPLPTVVQYLGYGGGRGLPHDHLFWASAGFAHVIMDSRGQGANWLGGAGATADIDPTGGGPQTPGVMTRGIRDPATSYYRRIYTDAVRLVHDLRGLDMIDMDRIVVLGGSQGGAIAQAVAGLAPVAAACIDVPFLTHIAQAITMTDREPYFEIVRYLRAHRSAEAEAEVRRTLTYIDGLGFAARATAPALYSVGLMDDICPPRTVFAAYNHYGGDKDITVYPFAQHEGGGTDQQARQLAFLRRVL